MSMLNRKITKSEYENALKILEDYGLDGWYQPLESEKEKRVYAKTIDSSL